MNSKILLVISLCICDAIHCLTISPERTAELAHWFARAMGEADKSYKQKIEHQNQLINISGFTQTEADIKLLIDMYKEEMNGGFKRMFQKTAYWKKNPPPKINSVKEMRAKENELITWVQKIYATSNSTPSVLGPTIQPLIKNVLRKERIHSSDFVFYHAYSLDLGLTFDLFRELQHFIFYAPTIFASEQVDRTSFKESILRYNAITKYKNAAQLVAAWKHNWIDHDPALSSLLLSTNIALFGNITSYGGESTFEYFLNSLSIAGAAHTTKWIDEIFEDWGFDVKFKKDLKDLFENFMKAQHGQLLQIFIPAQLVNKFAYIARAFGKPYDDNLLKKTMVPNKPFNTLDALTFYKKAQFVPRMYLTEYDSLQARVVLLTDFFDLNNNIKIYKYTSSEIAGEFGDDYNEGLRIIIGKMMIDYLIRNEARIRAGRNESLKNMLYAIIDWTDKKDAHENALLEGEALKHQADMLLKDNLIKEKLEKEKIKAKTIKEAKEKLAKDALKAKAVKEALDKEKQFQNTVKQLLTLAPLFKEFKEAQLSKKTAKISALKKPVAAATNTLKKINVHIRNAQGLTPLMFNPQIAPILHGLDKKNAKIAANAKNPKGKTVLQLLIQSKVFDQAYLYRAIASSGAVITNNDIKAVANKLKKKPAIKKQIVTLLQNWQKINK